MRGGLRRAVPWWLRVPLKIVLSRLPVPYWLWKRLRLFEHGTMEQPQVAVGTLLEHARTAELVDESGTQPRFVDRPDFTVLEIGPGDSLASGIVARALGAVQTILVDAGDFAKRDPAVYRRLVAHLVVAGYDDPVRGADANVDAMLHACGARYLTQGVDALASLPAQSVDFCFSNAVMEHIPRAEFARMAHELARILKPHGVCVHRVDFQDHLGGGLNNLRFSDRVWEGRLFARSGFYTNRIRPQAMQALFESAGLRCEVMRQLRWSALPIRREALDPFFRDLSEDDLRTYGMDIRLKRA